MELRVLKYFLMVAREENITRAANLLHVTQPTLSRQLMQLEEELGVKLFERGNHSITLTDDGMLLRRRAKEIIDLTEKTEEELSHRDQEIAGTVAIGCGETKNMSFLSQRIIEFRERYPLVRFHIYSATADEIKERIEKGLLDIGLLLEPVDISRFEFIRMREKEQWGILVREDSELAGQPFVSPRDLAKVPLIMAEREVVQRDLANWFGDLYENLEIVSNYNLLLNAANMAKHGGGAVLCFNMESGYSGLKFVPLFPRLESGAVLVWKKDQAFSVAAKRFIERAKQCILGMPEDA